MTPRRKKIAVVSVALTAIIGGFGLFNALSVQGEGTLAQAPLNVSSPAKTAFIMAVDDSNSMTFERIFAGGDGRMQWNSGNSSFFKADGTFFNVGAGCGQYWNGSQWMGDDDCYLYLFPHSGYNAAYSPGAAIPPFDSLGFARSPEVNKGYFNPNVEYLPWITASGEGRWDEPNNNATRADPRSEVNFATGYAATYDLESVPGVRTNGLLSGGASGSFSVLRGMTIPSGTIYRSSSRTCNSNNGNGLPATNNGRWTVLQNAVTAQANCRVDIAYYTATFYLPAAAPAPAGYKTADVNRPVIANACGPGCDLRRYEIKEANYTSGYSDAINNYATWFQYHRSRLLAMVGSMTESVNTVQKMRIGYFTINNQVNVTMHDVSEPAGKTALLTEVTRLRPLGGTPNRTAVDFMMRQFNRTGNGAPVLLSCQKNAGMLFTDGYTNSGNTVSGYGNADQGRGTPFADVYSNTMADIAARYYYGVNDAPALRADLEAGKVLVPKECGTLDQNSADWKRLDCQKNLHVNFYGVTLGAQGRVYDVNQQATADPYANPPDWNGNGQIDPSSRDDGVVVDEIWHAAVNSRGEFINAQTPVDVTSAMQRILALAGEADTPSGGIALTGSRIGTGSFSVLPFYEATNNSTDWYGRLTAQTMAQRAGTRSELDYTTIWEASSVLPAAARRNIWVARPTGVQAFNATNVGSLANLCNNTDPNVTSGCTGAVNAQGVSTELGITLDEAIAYLRGDQTLEVSASTQMRQLRQRTTRLGDIVNSSPIISAPTDDYGYRSIYNPSSNVYDAYGYAAYLESKKNRVPMVYVGANDGMLHAFNGTSGVEQFAYIPQTALGHMGNLLFPNVLANTGGQEFQHRYYVDGPVVVSDVAYSAGNWKTVVVGTMGAGGKGAFALDVTTPSSFTASSRLWEINDRGADTNITRNIGYVLGKPVIVPVRSNSGTVSWKAIFGNGYGSTNGSASLFVVDIQTGKVNILPALDATAVGRNGLGNIVVVDRFSARRPDGTMSSTQDQQVRDGFADTVYAADQQGAVWRFDLRNLPAVTGTSAVQTTALVTPLFIATNPTGVRQPIIGGLQASSGPSGGVMVYFGTGAFSFENDANDLSVQTVYGVLDLPGRTATLTRANLQQQTVTTRTVNDVTTKTLSSNAMASGRLGWYMDLTGYGERFVGYPELANGSIFFTTFELTASSGCGATGTNWLYQLNALSGASASSTGMATRLNTPGTQPIKDIAVVSTGRVSPLAEDATDDDLEQALGEQCSMIVQAAGADPIALPRACGRQSWRQVK